MRIILILILLGTLISSCNNTSRKPVANEADKPATFTEVPLFNADSAYEYVRAQLAFGPRVPNTPAHAACAGYLTEKLKQWSPEVIVQEAGVKTWDNKTLRMKNIIASWKPETNNRILLCAHWDSRPYADHDPDPALRKHPVEGANDGASGVGILLELARQIHLKAPEIGVDIILFDAEDYGPHQDNQSHTEGNDWWGLGSQYWSENPHRKNYFAKYGILLDMVGAPGATFPMEGNSMQFAPEILKKVWNTAHRIGFSSYFLFEPGGMILDDHYYINTLTGIPTIDIIHLDKNSSTGFYPYWHTTKDNLAAIDKSTLKVVGQTVLTVLYEER